MNKRHAGNDERPRDIAAFIIRRAFARPAGSSGLRSRISVNLALSMPVSRTRFRSNRRTISVRETSGANIRGTVLCVASSSVKLLLHFLNVENCVH
jgi:hypothetical protein